MFFYLQGKSFFRIFAAMILSEAIARFVDYVRTESRLAEGTVRNYHGDLDDFAAYAASVGVTTLDELTAREVRGWQMAHMERGEKAGTVKRRLSSLSSFFRYLRRHGMLDRDIMAKVTPPRQPKRLPVFFREKELEHLYDDGIFADDFEGRRDALALRLLYETGIRRSELTGLREAWADLSALTLKVLGKRDKERLIPIESELAHNISDFLALKHQMVGPTEWLLTDKQGRQLTPGKVYRIVKKYMTPLSTADRISPHVFRHSFATHILDEGGNIQAIKELLGHADLSTTEIYTHVSREHLKSVYKHAHPRGKGSRDGDK